MLSGPAQGGDEREKSSVMRVAGDREIERDAQRLVGDAVIVEEIVVRIGAVGQRGDIGAHQRLGARGQLGERRRDRVVAVFVEQRMRAAARRDRAR